MWAVEIASTGTFAGFVGLNPTTFDAPFTPAVDIGCRLARAYWEQGLATEGERSVVDYAFATLDLDEIVSFTSTGSFRSQNIMK